MFVPFERQPDPAAVPTVFPTPFRPGDPHPLAAHAALQTQAFISAHPWIDDAMFRGELGGKMLGVLVVRHSDGRIGYLRGFAGMLGAKRLVEGFVPPAFDVEAFDRLWTEGARQISALDARIVELKECKVRTSGQTKQLAELVQEQRVLSQTLLPQLRETYTIRNARGGVATLDALFEPRTPPGGAGDCAGPKLIAAALAMNAMPLALAEFWWGSSPPAGGRHHGVYYPACRGKCAKIIPFMLEGIECEPPPDVGMLGVPEDAPLAVYEDDVLLVVDKPCGLLSVPGRGPRRRDSVEFRLQARCGLADPTWPRLAHRLDLATSGVLVAAKTKAAYVHLQQQFSRREVQKRYVAVLQGHPSSDADSGSIRLALRVDLEDRPRQIFDPEHGRAAHTDWTLLERGAHNTRVAFFPRTGRTHQLRLHAAHPEGLGAPIVGDWLYGFGGDRLMLHAESIGFAHPISGEPRMFEVKCPF